MDTILIHAESKEQIKAFEQMAKALKVPFEIKADKYFKKGKGRKIKLDDIWK